MALYSMRLFASFAMLVACSGGPSRPQMSPALEVTRETPAAPVAANAPAPPLTPPPTLVWLDFDALPPGAVKRLGSQRLTSDSAVVAISDDGTMAVIEDDLGLVEIRADGMYRIVAREGCVDASGDFVRYVGNELRAECNNKLYVVRGDQVTAIDSPCNNGNIALSPSGEYLACVRRTDKNHDVVLHRWPTTKVWTASIPEEPHVVHVSNRGDVILLGDKHVRVVRDGRERWRKPFDLEWSGLDDAHLIGWEDAHYRFVRIALGDGKAASRTPLKEGSVARQIAVVPGGASYFVSLYGRYPGDPADKVETFRARVDAKTGKVLAAWRGPHVEWGNAVSANGRFAASVGLGRLMRVRLDDPSAPPDRTADGDVATVIAVSPDHRTVAYASSRLDELLLFDVESSAQRARVPATRFIATLAFSTDGKRVALAGKHGDFAIRDAYTGAVQCTSDEIAGSTVWWHGSRLVAHYPGDNGDDCDEITEGSITVLDDRCRIIERHNIYGMMTWLDATSDRTTVAMAAWKNQCGYGYDLKPWQAFAINHDTGAKTRLPKLDGEQARRDKEIAAAHDAGTPTEADGSLVTSSDGSTRLVLELDHDRYVLRCSDAKTGNPLTSHALPKGLFGPVALASDGRWSVVADRSSLLVYPCRR